MTLCNKQQCTGCGACLNICPQKCISMEYDEEGFLFPIINTEVCISCNLCRKTCPANQILHSDNITPEIVVGCQILDRSTLQNSSSGGAFSALAETVIELDGVVFASASDEKLLPYHIQVSDKTRIEKLRGSKYVQSDTRRTYSQVKQCLMRKQLVLYVGCPCQIAGLYAYLGDEQQNNLITVDLVCHGVGSSKLFLQEINELETTHHSKVVSFRFRSKERWSQGHYLCQVQMSNEKTVYIRGVRDKYVSCYLHEAIYRESCYQCQYAQVPRVGDFTIGDFVGIDKKMLPAGMYKRGMSVLLLNNEKAECFFKQIEAKLWWIERPFEEAASSNKNIIQPCKRPACRDYLATTNTTSDALFSECRYSLKNRISMILGKRAAKFYLRVKAIIKRDKGI